MKRIIATIFAITCLTATGSAFAQARVMGADTLPQAVQSGIQSSLIRAEQQGEIATVSLVSEDVGEEALAEFLDGAVVRLTLRPDGSYEAAARPGGDVVGFSIGRKKVALDGEESDDDGWMAETGSYDVPKRSQAVKLTLEAYGREIPVDCETKFKRTEQVVTYYVGPLNGLFCIGLAGPEGEMSLASATPGH